MTKIQGSCQVIFLMVIIILISDQLLLTFSMYGGKKFMKGLVIGHMLGMRKVPIYHHRHGDHLLYPPIIGPQLISGAPYPVPVPVPSPVGVATPMTLPFTGMPGFTTPFAVNPFGMNLLPQGVIPFGLPGTMWVYLLPWLLLTRLHFEWWQSIWVIIEILFLFLLQTLFIFVTCICTLLFSNLLKCLVFTHRGYVILLAFCMNDPKWLCTSNDVILCKMGM